MVCPASCEGFARSFHNEPAGKRSCFPCRNIPALFNRCVLNWFGDWSDQAFYQVGMEFTRTLDLDLASYSAPVHFPIAYRELSMPPIHRTVIVNALVYVHIHVSNKSTDQPPSRSIQLCHASALFGPVSLVRNFNATSI